MAVFKDHRARPRLRLAALGIAAAVVLAACGDSGSSSSSQNSSAVASPTTTFAAAATTAAPSAQSGQSSSSVTTDGSRTDSGTGSASGAATEPGLAVPTALTPADIGRDIVFTATIDVEVADVAAAGAEARDAIVAVGGIVFGESTSTVGNPRTVLIFKVQPADFDKALAAIARLGDLVNQQVSADDVTDRIVDLQSRVTTAEASVGRLRDLLDRAGDINALASLENQLLQRETQLEQLRGQLRTVQDQVALATITLTITQAATVIPPAAIEIVAGLGVDTAKACPGSLDLTVGRNDTAVLCVEIDNIGESPLTSIRLESGSLRLRISDFTVVEGSLDQLDPGGRLVVSTKLAMEDGRVRRRGATGGLEIDLLATADPAEARGGAVQAFTSVTIVSKTDTSLPGFGDSFSAGASALGFIGSIALVITGGLLPFLPLILIFGALAWWTRRRWLQASFQVVEEEPPAQSPPDATTVPGGTGPGHRGRIGDPD